MTLSQRSAATVRAALPAVGAALGAITERFCAGLFRSPPRASERPVQPGQPGLRRPAPGAGRFVAAFATHLLDRPDRRPDAVLRRIAHKHASLGVAPEQYAITHEHPSTRVTNLSGQHT